jgi:ABC-type sugar transport system permease subunit
MVVQNLRLLRKYGHWYLFISPLVILFLIFGLGSFAFLFILSFMKWDLLTTAQFAGLENYVWLIEGDPFQVALTNTFLFVLMFVIPNLLISLVLALIVNQPVRARGLIRSMYFVPVVISITVVAIIWRWLFSPSNTGPLNYLLALFGIPPQPWIASVQQALPSVAIMSLWASTGYYMLLWLAGFQSIPEEIIDAALVDGATRLERLWYVILPMLQPTWFLILLMSTLGCLKLFSHAYLLTGGGPVQATHTIVLLMWKEAFIHQHMGRAAAIAIVLLLVALMLSWFMRKNLETPSGREL